MMQEYDSKWNFPYGEKNVDLLKRIIGMLDEPNAIILDSFAGSGTTAHAVLDLNNEDSGNRKFILVECEDYADKITAERVRRVIKGVKTAKEEMQLVRNHLKLKTDELSISDYLRKNFPEILGSIQ